ncbi:isoaspartyl peptidase/L-asparaginase family protein [Deinococcus maricopensis]|uniref:Peptidase T2 asparaginase 2 n=1 Tax=Deinococcus maricopensis (strain DSM 21211 / LMG 22137 / NRRL B-23946 / LB-34) TaxID=709986 RepID=E8U3R9_DEIML|nr:isoaspartyl peptidase/L-asparaginase family protein [Deinococcus maricopensis]ADV68762.1 peptidase T2 asparaginase 2 [Deinococcus maricopensis DSM 21211]
MTDARAAAPHAEWMIVVHGGAKTIQPHEEPANREGCLRALAAGRAVLAANGRAVDAVTAAIQVLEAESAFHAGPGGAPSAGDGELGAALMDGETLQVGAVAALRGMPHPILVARALLPEPENLLVGAVAARFAAQRGVPLRDAPAAARDAVGCVARDARGHLAAGTSTGGPDGQCGDSPVPGGGFLADDTRGAAALSGNGARIDRVTLARRAVAGLREHQPDGAVHDALRTMQVHAGGGAGIILLDPDGRLGWGHTSSHFACAWQSARDAHPTVHLRRAAPPVGADKGD